MALSITDWEPDDGSMFPSNAVVFSFFLEDDTNDIDTDLVSVSVLGESLTVSNGYLEYWDATGRSGDSVVEDLKTLWFGVTVPSDKWPSESGQSISVSVKYDGTEVDTATYYSGLYDFNTETGGTETAILAASDPMAASRPEAMFVFMEKYVFTDRMVEFYLIEDLFRAAADVQFFIGHEVISDIPGELLAADVVIDESSGELLVNGYKLDELDGELLVQGYFFFDSSGELVLYVDTIKDASIGEIIVAATELTELPGELVVYKVDRGTVVDIMVVSSDTKDVFTSLGIQIDNEV